MLIFRMKPLPPSDPVEDPANRVFWRFLKMSWPIWALLILLILHLLNKPLPLARAMSQPAQTIEDTNGILLSIRAAPDGALRLPLVQPAPAKVREILTAFEDRWFDWHPGINPVALVRALIFNLSHKRKIGASTLSMQVARLLRPARRDLTNKLIEMGIALRLEWQLEKEEILSLWLNLTPYGGNVVGFRAAALLWFEKEPHELTDTEIAWLISLPKNPQASFSVHHANYVKVLRAMQKSSLITPGELTLALKERLPPRRRPVPLKIPHLSTQRLRNQTSLSLTVDLNLQKPAEQTARIMREAVIPFGGLHASLLLVRLSDFSVGAYVGSNDFYGFEGQNDGLLQFRSPGSILKPFAYALALEQGKLHPATQLADFPVGFDSWNPGSPNEAYFGLVSAATALRASLNIPAVAVAQSLENPDFHTWLKQTDSVSKLGSSTWHGLGLVLGSAGLNALEIARLYGILASEGKLRPLKLFRDQDQVGRHGGISPATATLIQDLLRRSSRPEVGGDVDWRSSSTDLAFKTGSSNHGRDVWVAAWSAEYLAVGWAGRFDGRKTSVPGSRETILAPVLNFLSQLTARKRMPDLPLSVTHEPVCQRLWHRPESTECEPTRLEPSLKIYQKAEHCEPPDTSLLKGLVRAGIPHQELCHENQDILLLEPLHQSIYFLNPLKKEAFVPVRCVSLGLDGPLSLYVNHKDVRQITQNQRIHLPLQAGVHQIECGQGLLISAQHTIRIQP